MLLRPDSKCLNHVKSGSVQAGGPQRSGGTLEASCTSRSLVATMPDVLQRQCGGIRGWKQELDGSRLVFLSDFCLHRVDVKSPRFTFELRFRKESRWRNQSETTGPPVAGQQVPTGSLAQSPSPAASDKRFKPVSDLCGRACL